MKAIVFDVDGTLTDGKIYMGGSGEVMKAFHVKDGCGIRELMPANHIIPVIITARKSEIVKMRCRELGVDMCFQGCHDKATKLEEIALVLGIQRGRNGIYEGIAYMGDDIVDLQVMKSCAVKGCPGDAVEEVKAVADFVSKYKVHLIWKKLLTNASHQIIIKQYVKRKIPGVNVIRAHMMHRSRHVNKLI